CHVWLNAQRPLVTIDCALGFPLIKESGPEIGMGFGKLGLQPHGLLERADRLNESALLHLNDSQATPCLGATWLGMNDLAIQPLRLCKRPGSMHFDRARE